MKKTLITLALTLGMSTAAMAWPDKTVNVVVPFPPGGSTDTIARTLANVMQAKSGQTFIVDNRAGATGTIGANHVARSAPDGHTILVASLGPYVIAPHLLKSVPYDALKDFDYLTVAVQAPNVLVVPAASANKSVADVIADLKANPGKVAFASSGNGSSDHLTAELFWQQTGTQGVHIPYRGGAPAINDLLGNQVQASFQNINAIVQHVKAGKLRALAVTGDKRSTLMPDVPTLSEAGVKDADVYSWQAIAAPKGLSADMKKKIHEALVAAINDPQVKPRLIEQGFEIVANTPEQFTAFQQQEFQRWKSLIQSRNITAD
ncbi:tripartite-type tricarboxylate transporter receptor subunit TctC [Hydrogenophaga palleronii]|uniref:Tripartite-type tricarboxylate transporter receptor subunit TctC n=1 Tax=Hydrogenophaga palleronii TaxID=65655 RepID=A0ABU1WQ28_9BURK|nr:tripartite tricarboxylate transporter substrate binding protein [Hydrogenophaga palleronii]MDR7151399.1 tripartite-type tricarboxylate transporter receptor subunit TctC [Hydrogenophaga palleronii]